MPIPLPDTGTANSSQPALEIDQQGTGEAIAARSQTGAAIAAKAGTGLAIHAATQGTLAVFAEGESVAVGARGELAGVFATGTANAVLAISDSGTGTATGSATGVGLHARSMTNAGVRAHSGQSVGVFATSDDDNAVLAQAKAAQKAAVFGLHDGVEGLGVVALAWNKGSIGVVADGQRAGIHASGEDAGVVAEANGGIAVTAISERDHGVFGVTHGAGKVAVVGAAEVDEDKAGDGAGVLGVSTHGAGVRARSTDGHGLDAESVAGSAALLRSASADAPAVQIEATNNAPGLRVRSAGRGGVVIVKPDTLSSIAGDAIGTHVPQDTGFGVYVGALPTIHHKRSGLTVQVDPGQVGLCCEKSDVSVVDGNVSVLGGDVQVLAGVVDAYGERDARPVVQGTADHGNYGGDMLSVTGVRGRARWRHGSARAITGVALDRDVYGQWAGYFVGDVRVMGSLYKCEVAFEIDHPQYPSEQYLRHVAIESDDRRTLYDGEVALDRRGRARVVLPSWFGALNSRPRFQLTAIGKPAPELHVIDDEIGEGRFEIAGGAPGQRVCWQVTATRNDRWAAAHPFEVEVPKRGRARGTYLHPEAHGVDPSLGEAWPDLHEPTKPDEHRVPRAREARREPQRAVRVERPRMPVTPPFPEPKTKLP